MILALNRCGKAHDATHNTQQQTTPHHTTKSILSSCFPCLALSTDVSQIRANRAAFCVCDFCERAGLRQTSEAPNVLLDIFTRDGRFAQRDGLRTSQAFQLWPSLKIFPMEPKRSTRSRFAWTLLSSVLWARIIGDAQQCVRDQQRTFPAQPKLLATFDPSSLTRQKP